MDPFPSVILGVLALAVTWGVWSYNQFIKDANRIEEAWGNIDVQLKRRRDLVPSLVEVVKGYVEHESTVLRTVTEKRTRSEEATGPRETAQEESSLSDQISQIMAVGEDYPDLKADDNFRQLQQTLTDIEDDIQSARRYYNGAVRNFNIRCDSFPSLLIARCFGFEPEDFFEVKLSTEREAPDVEFD